MIQQITIKKRAIGPKEPPFIVAEMSGNHNQSLERALKLVYEAHRAGAHAIKLQTYTPETITLKVKTGDFLIKDKKSLWYGKSLYELYEEASTPWKWHKPIYDYAKKLGIIAFSTPFDHTAVDFLETLDTPCYKIASLEIVDHPLIEKVAKTKKPLILSTGAATLAEIDEAVQVAKNAGCKELVLLKCTSAYPALPETMNLQTLPNLAANFSCPVGLSDHSPGIGVCIASISLGAALIEKHLTLSRKDGGVDAAFSLEPAEFKMLVDECQRAFLAQGKVEYGMNPTEKTSHSLRRSLYFVKDIKKGELITESHIRSVRPGFGLHPKYYQVVIGAKASSAIKKATPVSWDLILGK